MAALLTGSGCAFTTVNVAPPAPQALAQPPMQGRGREIALMVPFADGRPQGDRCGMKKNGFGMDTADVQCTVPPSTWMANALVHGLYTAGYRVMLNPPAPNARAVRIDGTLLQFFVEPDVGFFTFSPEADISVKLVVTSQTGLRAERVFYLKGIETSMVGTDDNFQKAAATATLQTVATMVSAITALLDRFPQLGAPVPPPQVSRLSTGEAAR